MKNTEEKKKHAGSFLRGILAGAAGASLILAGTVAVLKLVDNNRLSTEAYGMSVLDNGSVQKGFFSNTEKLVDSNFLVKLQGIESWVNQYFLFDMPETADIQTEIYRAYMNSLGDDYSCYYTAEEYDDMMESTNGTYYGIGVMVSQDPETKDTTAIRVFAGSPGETAGMLAGDVIRAVDGLDVTAMDLNAIVAHIKGERDTPVVITVYRPSTDETLDLTVYRDKIEVPTIESQMLENDLGYIQVVEFEGVTAKQFAERIQGLKDDGMKGLIIDLRDNPGGLLDVVLDMLDQMLPEGTLLTTGDKNGNGEKFTSDAEHYFDLPLVVLVNENSASASEVFTGAIRDYNAGLVVGVRTFGKGIVQSIFPLNDGSAIKLTVSRYFTPSGECIHGEGITPDIVVPLNEELKTQSTITQEEDNQLQTAITALKALVNGEDPYEATGIEKTIAPAAAADDGSI